MGNVKGASKERKASTEKGASEPNNYDDRKVADKVVQDMLLRYPFLKSVVEYSAIIEGTNDTKVDRVKRKLYQSLLSSADNNADNRFVGEAFGPHALIQKSREGSTRAKVDEVAEPIGLTNKEVAKVLNISERILSTKKGDEKLSSDSTERLLLLEKLITHGLDVFDGDSETLAGWMRTPIRELNNQSPLEVLDTVTGFTLVDDVLTRIDYGIVS